MTGSPRNASQRLDPLLPPIDGRGPAARAAAGGVLPGVQMLRAVAVLGVLLHHVLEESHDLIGPTGAPAWIILLGASGVDVFFCISGFIMLHVNRHRFRLSGAAADFVIRRVVRVVPLYWACTLFVVALFASGLAYRNADLTVSSVVQSLLFLPNDRVVVYVGWTLNYEAYFYLIFAALLAWVPLRRLPETLLAVLLIPMAVGLLLPEGATRHFLANPIALEFWFGATVAVLLLKGPPRFGRTALAVGCCGLLLGSLFGPRVGTSALTPETRFLLWGLPSAGLLWFAVSIDWVRGPVGRALMVLGNASYSIYLTHALVMPTYARLIKAGMLSNIPAAVSMTAVVGLSLALGTAVSIVFERPADRWLRDILRAHLRIPSGRAGDTRPAMAGPRPS